MMKGIEIMNDIDKNVYQAAVLLINTLGEAINHANSPEITTAIEVLKSSTNRIHRDLASGFERKIQQVKEVGITGIASHNSSTVFLDLIYKTMVQGEIDRKMMENEDDQLEPPGYPY